jgi:aspartate/methionine/tyrosine aminotransferase
MSHPHGSDVARARISAQSARLVGDEPAIARAHFIAEADPYRPGLRPAGYLNLGTAENRLVWDLLAGWFTPDAANAFRATESDLRYAPLHGEPGLREAIAAHLTPVCGAPVDPDHLIVVSGATAALDLAATVLCDPGDAIVVPAPFYGAFTTDLTGRSGARLIPAPMPAADDFRLRPSLVDDVIRAARADGARVRAIALTSPTNPVGGVHDTATMKELQDVAAVNGVDIIADEIYAQSVFGPTPFVSAVDPSLGADGRARTHVIWGFAKDFGLPGLKVGVLYTQDTEVAAAARALAYFAPVSTHTQALLRAMLTDPVWVTGFLTESRSRLLRSYEGAAGALRAHGIPFVEAEAGFSIWVDLRAWLGGTAGSGPWQAEQALWHRLFTEARVSMLPGEVFAAAEPGWFRLCHTTDPLVVGEAVARTARLLAGEAPIAGAASIDSRE